MVALDIVRHSNSRLKAVGIPKVAVFVGGTSGIGHLALTELVESGSSTKIYLIGRPSAAARTETRIAHFRTINPNVEIVWLEGEISLLSDVARICTDIKSKESTLDLLFLSAGFLPFSGRRETSEGLDTSQSVLYFSRITFIISLLPLLSSSSTARVVSIMGGGKERAKIDLEDLELKKPGAFGAVRSQTHLIAMTTLTMDKLAERNKAVTFIHTFPGQVDTGNLRADLSPNSPLSWLLWIVVEPLIRLIGLSHKESGQRHLYVGTSAMYGGRGIPTELPQASNSRGKMEPGLFLVNQYCEANFDKTILDQLRDSAQSIVWEHTQKVIGEFI
ncbi:hypothetical protein B0J13DRAFT_105051 [Dactylonectria estremocensis]|uniref:Uncharacterized protein n=1 Tax=Dactylonectria estremocensis TaxID=1079267 RepID=A0A9P9IT58_9HYPO|nr:hypothetical protein B0J13DRAFT_105051 [Dactylonectria estremocensis]